MIKELKYIEQQKPQIKIQSAEPSSFQTNSYNNIPLEPNYMGKSELMERKQELSNNAFMQRQKEYEKMFEKPTVPEVNFKEKLDDEPISNMEELIQKQQAERNTYMNLHPMPAQGISPPVNSANNIQLIPENQPINNMDQPTSNSNEKYN